MDRRIERLPAAHRGLAGLLTVAARVGRGLTLAALVLGGAAVGLLPQPAAAGDVNQCPADRPCITELFVTPYSVLSARWTGNWDHYNIRWENPQLVKTDDVKTHTAGITVLVSAWNRTYRFSVQGCNGGGFLNPSKCTGWAAREIKLQAPAAPTNAKLTGDTVTWTRTDSLTFHVELWGTPRAGGAAKLINHVAPPAKQLSLPAGWRDQFGAVKICAQNPAGSNCADIFVLANPKPAPAPAPRPPAPAAPASFTGTRDGGFGSRIILSWTGVPAAEYYYLTAASAQTGQPLSFPLPAPAPKLGAGSTTFVVDGQAAAVVGGLEFRLQACNQGGCSAQVKATVQ